MWVYAFGFAPRESFNKINDEAWQARAQAHCKKAEDQRFSLEDLTPMKVDDPAALLKKAKIVEAATDTLENAINLIAADRPTDAKGQELVPKWIADYRIYISDRRAFIVALRTTSNPELYVLAIICLGCIISSILATSHRIVEQSKISSPSSSSIIQCKIAIPCLSMFAC